MRGKSKCYSHGGATPSGEQAGSFKHGRYSKYLPARLLANYDESRRDPEQLKLTNEIAALDTRIAEMLQQVDTGEAGSLWRECKKRLTQFQKAQAEGDATKAGEALNALLRAVDAGATDAAKWREILSAFDARRRLVESERRRVVEAQQVLTLQDAGSLITALLQAVKTNVTDLDTRERISAEFERLANRPDNNRLALVR